MTPGRPRPRPELTALQAYRTSDTTSGRILLHANENPYAPPEHIVDEIYALARKHGLNRYPEGGDELAAELSAYAGVPPEWIWVGDGSNEVLLQACLAYGGPGRKALVFEPTYRMHHRQAAMAGTQVIEAHRESDFRLDVYKATEAIEAEQPDIVFVCTPNNPTGTTSSLDDLQQIARRAPGLVVIDEAYHEFCGATFIGSLGEFPNVLVVRTLSKAFRLAAVRLGYGIAAPELLGELARVRMPYAQSSFTQAAGVVALRNRAELLQAVPAVIAERERIADALRRIGDVRVYHSGANFLMFRWARAGALVDALSARGIVIRDFRHLPGCEDCVRVTVGNPDENDEFLDVVGSVAGP
jgi:histidinol-phosphate aminotransferase